jgi:hypothetical protein
MTNDVSVINYGREQIRKEKVHKIMQSLETSKGKKKPSQ